MAKPSEAEVNALNTFCANHRVVSVDKQFVAQGELSFWSVCVQYIVHDGEKRNGVESKRERIDYREILNEQDFTVYADLRALRKSIAERDGIPLYALFTNGQLAEMVTSRVMTISAMGAIDGIGKARVEKYSEVFLQLLIRAFSTNSGNLDEKNNGLTK